MANTKISALTANTNPNWSEEFVYAYNNANGKITLNTMKAFVWWAWITTLNADANIWELSEWTYVTAYDLYYKTWEAVPARWTSKSQMIFVTEETTWQKWYFVFSAWHTSSVYTSKISYGYSLSSSDWTCNEMWARDWSLIQYEEANYSVQAFRADNISQKISNITSSTQELAVSTSTPPYAWVTYTVYIDSVQSWDTYSITLWGWITNPFNITLPSGSNKKCLITVLMTSTTTWIVTWCTIES